jgi:hypothetical protein
MVESLQTLDTILHAVACGGDNGRRGLCGFVTLVTLALVPISLAGGTDEPEHAISATELAPKLVLAVAQFGVGVVNTDHFSPFR